jgi:hypothetical protein
MKDLTLCPRPDDPTITYDLVRLTITSGLSECGMGVSSKSVIVRRTGWPFPASAHPILGTPRSATESRKTFVSTV